MAKENIERTEIKDPNLKQIIVRLDYAGVSDQRDLVKLFDKTFPKEFKQKNEVYTKNYAFWQEDLQEISIPVKVIQEERKQQYGKLKNVNGIAILDLSQYYMCMTIQVGNNYEGLDAYTECFKGAIKVFKDKIAYFSPRRLGIRKIRTEKFATLDASNNTFETFIFNTPTFDLHQPSQTKAVYFNHLSDNEHEGLRYNVRRECLKLVDERGENDGFLMTLDIDAYYSDESILNSKRVSDLLNEANLQEFNLYRACMTEQYLREHRR